MQKDRMAVGKELQKERETDFRQAHMKIVWQKNNVVREREGVEKTFEKFEKEHKKI